MKKQEKYLNELLIKGFVDARKLAGVANATKLPNGEVGFCLMCLDGSTLNFYDTNLKQEVGALLYSVDLKKATNLKTSSFIFNSYINLLITDLIISWLTVCIRSFTKQLKKKT